MGASPPKPFKTDYHNKIMHGLKLLLSCVQQAVPGTCVLEPSITVGVGRGMNATGGAGIHPGSPMEKAPGI